VTRCRPRSPARRAAERPRSLSRWGVCTGIVAVTIPVAVFVVVKITGALQPALIAALAAGVLIACVAIVRRQPLQPASRDCSASGVAAYTYRTGEARGSIARHDYSAVSRWRSVSC